VESKARLRKAPRRTTAFLLFWVGELTYPIYLVHVAILLSVLGKLPHQTYAAKWAIATILVILIAWVFHMAVEEPVLKWRRRTLRAAETEKWMEPETRHGDLRVASGSVVDSLDPVANGDLYSCLGEPVANPVKSEVI
jgi:peptidoglycan/LPS O-acetylase OafA/YrhL